MSNSLIEVKDLKVYFKQKSPKLLSFQAGYPESCRSGELFH